MTLRGQVLAGGRYLVAREAIGIVVRSLGLVLLTRLLGPLQYGLFAGPNLVVIFLTVLATAGTDIFLIRHPGELARTWYDQVFSFLLVGSSAVAAVAVLCGGLVGHLLGDPRYVRPFQVLALSIPINVLWIPGRARLEREFRYRKLAWVEVGADVCQYVLGVALAFMGWGVWAAVDSFLARQAWMLVSVYVLASYRPRWRWETRRVGEMLGFGWVQSTTAIANRGGDMVVPIVVGGFLGPRAVGIAALTLRLAETLSFVNRATYRLSIVTLSKIHDDLSRLKRAVEGAMSLQMLGAAIPLVTFSVVGTVVVPLFLGPRWRAVLELFPFIALNYAVVSLFTMQQAALIVVGRNRAVMFTNLTALVLLYAVGVVLVPLLGLPGYGLTETVAIAGQYVNHRVMRRVMPGGVSYSASLPWLLGFAPLLFFPVVPWPWRLALVAAPLAVIVKPRMRADARRQLGVLQSARLARAGAAQVDL